MEREKLNSRLGFILLSAGCAIGIGNVWKFPYMVGKFGGSIFVFLYLFFLAILGIPILTMEFALGRSSRKSPALMYKKLEPVNTKWHLHGYITFAGNYLLMMFYTTVSGWILNYFVKMVTGRFQNAGIREIEVIYSDMLKDPVSSVAYMGIVVIIGFLVCSLGLQKGVERITKFMMLALLLIMVVLAINSIFLPGGKEGIKFYLLPQIENIKKVGFGNVITGAMNQAFFTLSLGIGSMAVFGSYMDKGRTLLGEAINVAVLDTFVAFTSGLIIFPAAFAYNISVNVGPNLIFITLPNIFNNLAFGRVWGSLFFVFMSFAALSTIFAVFENIIACTRDIFNISRQKACVINVILLFIFSLPCALGFNLLSFIKPFGHNTSIMDLEDFVLSNIMLPLGALVFILFCVCRYGWGWKNFINEANNGKGLKIPNWMRGYITYILPLIILIIFVYGLITFKY